MMKFRKKPVVVDAARFEGGPGNASMIRNHFAPAPVSYSEQSDCLNITTLEGVMRADPGDWIIRGVKGELYPCKPDIFAATYEPA